MKTGSDSQSIAKVVSLSPAWPKISWPVNPDCLFQAQPRRNLPTVLHRFFTGNLLPKFFDRAVYQLSRPNQSFLSTIRSR